MLMETAGYKMQPEGKVQYGWRKIDARTTTKR